MRRAALLAALSALVASCGGGGSDKQPLFQDKPECEGEAIVPLQGEEPMVISAIEIGAKEDGLDLDGDGMPDNALYGISDFARDSIKQSFDHFDIVAPIEFFDFADPGPDDCVKFAVYLGSYKADADGDSGETANDNGDCNDTVAAIHKGAAEVADNFIDDDCDGLADETDQPTDGGVMTVPSADTMDRDSDGVTIADGDCDDTNASVAKGKPEVCGDGLDNDCDGNADWGTDADGNPVCTPYDADTPDPIALEAQSFNDDGSPVIAFRSGTVTRDDSGQLILEAGPALFKINFPIADGVNLDMRITGATIRAELVMTPAGWMLQHGQLGGVIDANTADQIRGLTVDQIDLKPEDSLLDAIFANVLGVLLALPRPQVDPSLGACMTPDIDVDQDGLEMFCDSNPEDMVKTVDTCVDGDGTVVHDGDDGHAQCTEAVDAKGTLRFTDGVSVELNFETVPALLPGPLP